MERWNTSQGIHRQGTAQMRIINECDNESEHSNQVAAKAKNELHQSQKITESYKDTIAIYRCSSHENAQAQIEQELPLRKRQSFNECATSAGLLAKNNRAN